MSSYIMSELRAFGYYVALSDGAFLVCFPDESQEILNYTQALELIECEYSKFDSEESARAGLSRAGFPIVESARDWSRAGLRAGLRA